MIAIDEAGLAWACAGCFALTVVSAIVPWVNAELIVLSLPVLAPSRSTLALLLLVATAGQMTGKVAVYWAARGGARVPSPRVARLLERWRPRFAASRRSAAGFVVLSSAVGIPPFFVTTLAAGALRMNLTEFIAAGTCGRLLRFGALVVVPDLVVRGLA
jgi:membrane protein YqaA with SNARE-associated domain